MLAKIRFSHDAAHFYENTFDISLSKKEYGSRVPTVLIVEHPFKHIGYAYIILHCVTMIGFTAHSIHLLLKCCCNRCIISVVCSQY